LEYLGLRLRVSGTTVHLEGPTGTWPALDAFQLEIPGDASSAAFLVAAAVLAEDGELRIEAVGVNPTRSGYLSVLARMGIAVQRLEPRMAGGEPVADLLVRPAEARPVHVRAEEIPGMIDEIPILAVLASRADGESRFRSVGELRVKESDRLGLLVQNLRALGVEAEVQGEDLVVLGGGRPPRGRVETAGDHRLAMAFAVLGTVPGAAVELSETRSPEVSYPGFFEDLRSVAADG
jgi:3-phosphoshikimate 1-carboxyvinyltransferase